MPAAERSSSRARRGTSTTVKAGRTTSARPTSGATSARRRKKAPASPTATASGPASPDNSETSGPGSVAGAVRRDLEAIAKLDPALARSGLAALALAMALEIDDPNSATSKSMCAAQLREALATLRALTPAEREVSAVDELRAARAKRLDRKSAS